MIEPISGASISAQFCSKQILRCVLSSNTKINEMGREAFRPQGQERFNREVWLLYAAILKFVHRQISNYEFLVIHTVRMKKFRTPEENLQEIFRKPQ